MLHFIGPIKLWCHVSSIIYLVFWLWSLLKTCKIYVLAWVLEMSNINVRKSVPSSPAVQHMLAIGGCVSDATWLSSCQRKQLTDVRRIQGRGHLSCGISNVGIVGDNWEEVGGIAMWTSMLALCFTWLLNISNILNLFAIKSAHFEFRHCCWFEYE